METTYWQYYSFGPSHFILNLVISSVNLKEWVLSVTYNAQSIVFQKNVWHALSCLSSLDLSWLLVGDFNAILAHNEHKGGVLITTLLSFIVLVSLFSITSFWILGLLVQILLSAMVKGFLLGYGPVLIDSLATPSWTSNFDSYSNQYLPRISSDHFPLFLSAKFKASHKSRIFRFKNLFIDHKGCHLSSNDQMVYWYRGRR